jgi:hypothetical protein
MKQAQKIKEKSELVRLSHDTYLELKFIKLVTKRSMSSIVTEFIGNVFGQCLNWKECQLWYDCTNGQVLITVAGKHPLLLLGTEEGVKAEIKKRVGGD